MLSRSSDILDVAMPGTFGRYSLTRDGILKNTVSEKSAIVEWSAYDEPIGEIDFGFGPVKMKIAVLLAIKFKQIKIPVSSWPRLDVKYVDGNPTNIDPSNTVLVFPAEGIKLDIRSDFRFIPGFSRYMINSSGEVYSTCTNERLSPYMDASGYWMYGVTPDVGKRTIVGMHRLLALAFLEYRANVDSLDVNHLDGNKGNNALDNLEWADRKRNCDHAYSTGLRTDNVNVMVRNVYTKEVREFYSIEECARKLKLNGETIRLRLQMDPGNVYYPGFQLKRKDDESPWTEHEDNFIAIRNTCVGIPLLTEDLNTGEIVAHENQISVGERVGLTSGAISYHMRGIVREKIVRNYRIFYPDFKELSLSYFAEM